MQYFGFIVLSLVILLLMVLIHESGHYTAAKILGFTVDEFSIGFGPKIFSKRRKNGELFSLRMLPLGGYCAFYGESDDDTKADSDGKDKTLTKSESGETRSNLCDADKTDACADKSERDDLFKTAAVHSSDTVTKPAENSAGGKNDSDANTPESDDDLLSFVMKNQPASDIAETKKAAEEKPVRLDKNGNPAKYFNEQKPWKRIIVLLGGVLFNFLSAIVFSLIYIGVVGYAVPKVDTVYTDKNGAPYCALMQGDIILAVNGEEITVLDTYSDISARYAQSDELVYRVDRDGKIIDVKAVRQEITVKGENGKEDSTYVGIGFSSQTEFIGNNAANAFTYCVPYTFKLSWAIIGSFGDLITGKVPITSVSGPIGSINLMAQLSIADWRNILILLPLLASNLAIFNILPFPALDGAHIVFTVIEWIRKKPINRKVEGMIHAVGMIVLLLFVLVVDILSFAL